MNTMLSGFLTWRGINFLFHLTCLGDRLDPDIYAALHRATPCHWLMPYGLGQFLKTSFADRHDKALELPNL
jgi:hypothetical protein